MLENYDTRLQIRELLLAFEQEHQEAPFEAAYAEGVRRAYGAFIEPAGPDRANPELRGVLDAVLSVVQEVGLESAQFLLAVGAREEL